MRNLTLKFLGWTFFFLVGVLNLTFGQVIMEAWNYSTGGLVTHPGQATGGADASAIPVGSQMFGGLGFQGQEQRDQSVADDFTLGVNTHIDSVQFYIVVEAEEGLDPGYTAKEVYVRIYNDNPRNGGTIIWGDFETDRMGIREYANIYRVPADNLLATGYPDIARPVFRITAKIDHDFAPGTYWLEMTVYSVLPVHPFSYVYFPPITILDNVNTGNGIMYNGGLWADMIDPGTKGHGGLPLDFYGKREVVECNPPMNMKAVSTIFPDWYSVDMTWDLPDDVTEEGAEEMGFNVYRGETKLNEEPLTELSFTDTAPAPGTYVYGVTTIVRDCESPKSTKTITLEETSCLVAIEIEDNVYAQSFEEGFPYCWKEIAEEGLTHWQIALGDVSYPESAYKGTRKALFMGENGATTKLVSPMFDLTQFEAPEVGFWHAQRASSGYQDELRVYYKNSETAEWIKIAEYTSEIVNWKRETIALPNPTATYWIAFEAKVDKGSGVMLDDIMVQELGGSACTKPTALSYTQNTPVEEWYNVNLSWDYPAGAFPGDAILLHDNGPIITHPGAGESGLDVSAVEANSGYGEEITQFYGYSIADDFTLNKATHIDQMVFYLFDGSATSTSPTYIEMIFLKIYDASPRTGGKVIWGNTQHNCINREQTIFSNILRANIETMEQGGFPIIRTVTDVDVTLPAGTYWVEIIGVSSISPSEGGSVVAVPVTILGEPTQGNAMVYSVASKTWYDWVTQKEHCELPFEVYGREMPMTYNIYRNETKVNKTPVAQNDYTDVAPGEGDYTYCVRALWSDGCESDAVCVSIEMEVDPCETPVTHFPFKEGFEKEKEMAPVTIDCWRQVSETAEMLGYKSYWDVREGDYMFPHTAHSGDRKAIFFGIDGSTTKLVLPMMDLSNLPNPVLNFWFAIDTSYGHINDFYVYYRNTPGGAWKRLAEYPDEYPDWTEDTLDLPEPTSTYWIAFEGVGEYGFNMLDDITVKEKEIVIGIESVTPESFKIYPNPTNGRVSIKTEGTAMQQVQLYDMTGRLIYEVNNINTAEYGLELSDYTDGVYFIKVDGQIRKVIKR